MSPRGEAGQEKGGFNTGYYAREEGRAVTSLSSTGDLVGKQVR